MIFAGFFAELARQGANWRECGPEKRCFCSEDAMQTIALSETAVAFVRVRVKKMQERMAAAMAAMHKPACE